MATFAAKYIVPADTVALAESAYLPKGEYGGDAIFEMIGEPGKAKPRLKRADLFLPQTVMLSVGRVSAQDADRVNVAAFVLDGRVTMRRG